LERPFVRDPTPCILSVVVPPCMMQAMRKQLTTPTGSVPQAHARACETVEAQRSCRAWDSDKHHAAHKDPPEYRDYTLPVRVVQGDCRSRKTKGC
jgi:hypothetical protein